MAAKYQLITVRFRRTGIAVAKNPQAWQSFLAAACRIYKCRFDEQLLIYAQRPDAIAVAELDTWNKRFKRWVNKDSKGIAVFDPKGRRKTLKYYFDVSDKHDGYYGSRHVQIRQMNGRYEQAVIERLSDRFGNTESTDLASALMETAKNAVEDNLQDYCSAFIPLYLTKPISAKGAAPRIHTQLRASAPKCGRRIKYSPTATPQASTEKMNCLSDSPKNILSV